MEERPTKYSQTLINLDILILNKSYLNEQFCRICSKFHQDWNNQNYSTDFQCNIQLLPLGARSKSDEKMVL